MKVVFELSNYGACSQVALFQGKSGKNYTFNNDRTGTGFKLPFEGTPEQYLATMRDLLGASHPFYKVYVHFVPEGKEVTPEILAHFESLAVRNEELETQNAALQDDLKEAKAALGKKSAAPAKKKAEPSPKAPAKPKANRPAAKKAVQPAAEGS